VAYEVSKMIKNVTTLEVATLGRFAVRRNQEWLSGGGWSRRKVVDLFKLLLSAEQHRLHREQAQDILWPDASLEQAANSFGKTLYLLRRALEPELAAGKGSASLYISLEHETLMLVSDAVSIDSDVFENSVRQLQARLRGSTGQKGGRQQAELLDAFDQALSLYKGDYLPDNLYDDWSQKRRDRLRRAHSWLLEQASELAITSGAGQRACEYLLALLEKNPADEQTHRQLMLVFARMGRRSDAINQYFALRKALKEELRALPLPETTGLLKRIQSGQIPVDLRDSRQENAPAAASSREEPAAGRAGAAPAGRIDATLVEGGASEKEETQAEQVIAQAARVEQATPPAIDPDRILKASLVGRADEIARMQRAFARARSGQQRVIFVSGEPGIGKSRLARDFTRWGEDARQATVLWGYCYEMSGLLPYQPLTEAIGAHARMQPPERLRAILGESAAHLAKIVPEIRSKLPELPQPEPPGPEAERQQIYSAVARYLSALAAGRPVILILDDLQWADAATIHLLNHLTLQLSGRSPDAADTASASPAPLFVALYRNGEVNETHPLRGLITTLLRVGVAEELRLQRLNEEEVHQLLVNMAGHAIQPTFAAEIHRQTEGNPFFVGEAIRSLILNGKIVWTGQYWRSTVKLSELDLPPSVRLLIERRLASFSPECRATLMLGAVIGRQFSSALLVQARAISEEAIAEHIESAIQGQMLASPTDLLRDRSGAITPYMASPAHARDIPEEQHITLPQHWHDLDLTFTHDNIREVLYQWLNPLRRRALHRQVAQAIETRYAAQLKPYYSQLAYHYQLADNYTKAVEYLLKAAEQASGVYAFVDAAEYVRTALDLLIGDAERLRRAVLLRQLGSIYLFTGRLDEAIQANLASAAIWRDIGNAGQQAEVYLDAAFCTHWQGRESEAVKYINSALDCIAAIADRPEAALLYAKAYAQWGLALTVMGEAPEALEKLSLADTYHAQVGGSDPFVSVVSLWSLAWCHYLTASPQEMLEFALKGADVCRSSNKPEWEPMMNYSAAWAYMLLGRLAEAQQAAQNALLRAQQYGVVAAQSWAYLVMAFVAIQAGRWNDAGAYADKSYAIAEMLHDADLQARGLWSRSVCAGWEDNWKQAIAHALAALDRASKGGEMSMIYPHLLAQAARAHFYAGDLAQAQTSLDSARQLAQSRHYHQLPAIIERVQGRIWQAQGRLDDALPCFERALAELQALNDAVEYARTEEAFGSYFLARANEGDVERGQALLESARATYRRLGING
jgi:predicted ATPase/DNA-binding SARP family transcriptional activator